MPRHFNAFAIRGTRIELVADGADATQMRDMLAERFSEDVLGRFDQFALSTPLDHGAFIMLGGWLVTQNVTRWSPYFAVVLGRDGDYLETATVNRDGAIGIIHRHYKQNHQTSVDLIRRLDALLQNGKAGEYMSDPSFVFILPHDWMGYHGI